ncbi:uncharacterized protein LOC132955804 [Labrus mixtus]|uniref:uncharacterized protein LOC132955804 n=1 Tax=Labrus mixtus TaxID=508554 RepID=UPI0029BFCC2F|nr:uncharacterized protein LOC132955804 [Labrus mixtus]
MTETFETNYQSISNMDQEQATLSGKNFYISVSGTTNGAHVPWVKKFRGMGHTEVQSEGESNYILLFCPIVSRVGTDISEAMENIQHSNKPVILVVMHHTFNTDYVLAESRRLVNNPNVYLVVDCLFHKGQLLNCNHNDIALFEIKKLLGVASLPAQGTIWGSFYSCVCSFFSGWSRSLICYFAAWIGVVVILIILLSVFSTRNK